MGRDRAARGFTLVELVVTVGIVALLLAMASYSLIRGRQRIGVERASLEIKGRLERARSLAAIAGSRAGTNRLQYGATCTDQEALVPNDPSQWQLWVRVNGNAIEFPSRVLPAPGGVDRLVVECETYDVAVATNGIARLSAPVAPGLLAFSPSGRAILQGIPGPYAYFQVEIVGDPKRYGVRVLPSGVTCQASVAAGPPWCDQS